MFKEKTNDTGTVSITIPCECGTHEIKITKFENDTCCYLSFFVDSFYLQDGIWKMICNRIKKAFSILCGKSYRYEEIVIQEEGLKEIRDGINKILNKGENNNEQN